MRYLLDVNVLIALSFDRHGLHQRAANWAFAQTDTTFLTCSITELGCIRVLAQARFYGISLEQACTGLAQLKLNGPRQFEFISDSNNISRLPAWVVTPAQTTDGHLLELAKAHGAVLATFDEKIPGAFLIP